MPDALRVYLAGPAVFLPDPMAAAARLKRFCAAVGLVGVFPLDGDPALAGRPPAAVALAIKTANCELIRGCHGLLADLSPFRGPGMDAGTAYEIGYAEALGLPVVCYSHDTRPYAMRVAALEALRRDPQGRLRDARDIEVEDFALAENLMIAAGRPVLSDPAEAAAALAALLARGSAA